MSHYLIELYTPNAAWQVLSADQRKKFLDGIQSAMSELSKLGIEVLALGENDRSIAQASEHRFVGIWRFPDQQARNVLLGGILASGWYNYFDHVNAASDAGGFEGHLVALARD
ncbi:exonuclease III [Paucibacter oligotrophus]|jgi:hypothetical protein|uniref:Exonuclease III n=2 Tax=Burkholderiales TaxID=80840 RepID=A0A840L8G8_9BURK|nr:MULTISPECIES: DUF6616 family protein [Burkholderiales]KQB57503.1 hypothetical protein AE621_20295 [Acidovorax sp. SD340]MBB4844376.1 exonuclease III [Roseateles oligotrophus]MBO1007944.1 hypothetical protein [Acidovorax sp. SD340]MCO4241463.1 hypothetical protein [Acidovorax facilis]